MDPNVTLANFLAAMNRADDMRDEDGEHSTDDRLETLQEAVDHASNLFEWLRTGGFAPDWSKR